MPPNQGIQSRLREEVTQALANGERPGYADIEQLKVLDAVVRETLRVYVIFFEKLFYKIGRTDG
jgi:hypothetical protein